jgi:hypothetical protein
MMSRSSWASRTFATDLEEFQALVNYSSSVEIFIHRSDPVQNILRDFSW